MEFPPGRYSSPIVMLCIFAQNCLVRLKPAMATSTSASAVSQFGLMRGGSYGILDVSIALSGNSTKRRTKLSLSISNISYSRVWYALARDRSDVYVPLCL